MPFSGEWLVVHSGYAIDRIDAEEAEAVAAELALVSAAEVSKRVGRTRG